LAHAQNDAKVPSRQSKEFYKAVLKNNPDYKIQYLELKGGHAIEGLDELNRYIESSLEFINQLD